MGDKTYCYADSNVLKNKLGIMNADILLQEEIFYTNHRMLQLQRQPVKGPFNFAKLKSIHAHIFQDLYTWAGKTRTVDIGKGNLFCLAQHIESYAQDVFRSFEADCVAVKNDPAKFIHAVTNHYADLNALHPFREGNGRTQREFTRQLCLYCGYDFDLTHTSHEEMLEASIASFDKGDNSGLEAIFQSAIKPINKPTELQNRLKNSITTLSHDDIPHNTYKKRMAQINEKFGHPLDLDNETVKQPSAKSPIGRRMPDGLDELLRQEMESDEHSRNGEDHPDP